MRLFPYVLLVYVMLGIQVGMARYLNAAPNLGLLAVLFISLHAPRRSALLSCLCVGLVQDLLTIQPPGLYALSYGLVAMLVVSLQHMVAREHPLTHVALALAGGFITMMVLLLHGWLRAPRIAAGTEFKRLLITAILAPLVLWILGKIRSAFAFQGSYRK